MQSTRVQQLIADAEATFDGLDVNDGSQLHARGILNQLAHELKIAHNQVQILAESMISDYIQAVEDDDIGDFASWVHDSSAWIANCNRAQECLKAIGILDTEAVVEEQRKLVHDGSIDYDDEECDDESSTS